MYKSRSLSINIFLEMSQQFKIYYNVMTPKLSTNVNRVVSQSISFIDHSILIVKGENQLRARAHTHTHTHTHTPLMMIQSLSSENLKASLTNFKVQQIRFSSVFTKHTLCTKNCARNYGHKNVCIIILTLFKSCQIDVFSIYIFFQ